jgi:3-methyladenine DNA glycosylase/8-oxoguanine DNA glycosylase
VNVINANVNEILLRQIEAALAKCQTLVSLYLPQAYGGRLETVQSLVQTLIQAVTDAGIDVCDAQCFYDRALIAIGEKEYKQALNCFMAAYQQLLRCSC